MEDKTDPLTVFIVDDDAAMRRSLAAVMRLFDLPVECFASAAEFLATYNPSRRGCLVLDVHLAGVSGVELQAQLASQGASLPTIFITGHAVPTMSEEVRSRGVIAVFQKPFRPQQLVDAIRGAIDAQR